MVFSHKMLSFDKPIAQPVVTVRDYLNKAMLVHCCVVGC